MFNYLFLFILIIFRIFELFNAEIVIRPPGIGKNNSIYILSANSSLQLDCEVELGDFNEIEDINSLEWIKDKMKIGNNWLSIYTQPKIDEKHRWLRQSLFIQKVTEQNEGEYKCVFFDDLQKTINLYILKNLEWKTKNDQIGVPIGQSITINCGAKGIKDENIKILNSKGKAIEETLNDILVTGEEITLIKIGKEHKGLKIRCVAIRPINLKSFGLTEDHLLLNNSIINTVHTDEHDLIINVWIPPKFDEHFTSSSSLNYHYYAIPGSKQLLRWTIIESNPPVKIWTLKKDGEIFLEKEKRIKIIQKLNETKPFFAISIENIQDEDYGRYTLIAHNGKLESQQTQILIITQPPTQPRVSIDWVSSNGSVSWKIEEKQNKNNNQLPISYFWIIYKPIKRISNIPLIIQNSSTKINELKTIIKTTTISSSLLLNNSSLIIKSYRVRRRKNINNLYEIAGLEPYTEYEFIFVGGNQAGESDPISIYLTTIDRQRLDNNNYEKEEEEINNLGINLTNSFKYLFIFYIIIINIF